MEKNATIEALQEPYDLIEFDSEGILIGRSKDCNIVIPEPYVSCNQAKIFFENDCYAIENLGRNPIYVNGIQTDNHFFKDEDHFLIGNREYIFRLKDSKPDYNGIVFEKNTFISPRSEMSTESMPKLVVISSDGQSKKYDINNDILIIGRTVKADIRIDDDAISRKHCAIIKYGDGYFIKNFSESNPLIFQKNPIEERRLMSGDQFEMGSYTISFLSDRPEDRQLVPKKTSSKRLRLGVWFVIAILLIALITYFLYYRIYIPWKAKETTSLSSTYLQNYQRQILTGCPKIPYAKIIPLSQINRRPGSAIIDLSSILPYPTIYKRQTLRLRKPVCT